MAVNTTAVLSTYDAMVNAVVNRYTVMWNANQIDAETYSKLVGEASSQFMQFAAELVQKQEQLDVQNQLVAQQVLNEAKQLELLGAQLQIAEQDLLLKQQQVDIVERDMVEKELTGAKQRTALDKDIAIKDYENTVLQVDQHNTNVKQQTLLDTQEQSEQYKVDYLLPKELAQIAAQVAVLELQDDELNKKILILEEQRKATKAEVVIKDKEAAKLGLDNVMKNAEAVRGTNPNAVYAPVYGV